MVKTLVFHTSNVGSIPPSLNMQAIYNYRRALPYTPLPIIRYSFRFTSLIPPFTDMISVDSGVNTVTSSSSRLLFRRSYLVLSWISYLTRFGKWRNKQFKPHLAILPSKRKLYTLTKAPMAHKTNSKEQFLFKFYNFKFSFELIPDSSTFKPTVLQGSHLMFLTRNLFPVFETNLLFLKYYEVTYPIRVIKFLNSTTL